MLVMRRKILRAMQAVRSEPFQVLPEQAYLCFGYRRLELYPDTFSVFAYPTASIVLDTLPK